MKKDTSEMLKELEQCEEFHAFHQTNESQLVDRSIADYVNELIAAKGLKKAEVIRRSGLSEPYGYQIFSGYRVPERPKLLSLAIGMQLDLHEVQTLLKHAGYAALYAKNEFDCVVIFGICKKLSVLDINALLYEYGLNVLG
ncbi:MAG: helix-turn-helix domain-containing protein [Clostridia bacterium]|nr:helix-turn-helix domain-containing protein [Clostridia bacterium]